MPSRREAALILHNKLAILAYRWHIEACKELLMAMLTYVVPRAQVMSREPQMVAQLTLPRQSRIFLY